MKNKTLCKFATITGIMGLIMIFSMIVSNTASPDMFFRICAPLGLLFIFISIIAGFISWIWYLKNTIKSKQYAWAGGIGILGMLVILKAIIRIL